jgi:4-hydroxy-tetrahydrodipicolinate reductase
MIRLGLVGASGRSGSFVLEAIRGSSSVTLHAALVSAASPLRGQEVRGLHVCYSHDLEDLIGSDVVVEFSNPEVSTQVADFCGRNLIPLVVATTGHSTSQLERIKGSAGRIALCIAPNTSVGATVLAALAEQAKQALGSDFDVELLDLHHRMKKDAPSGTALAVLEPLIRDRELVYGRPGLRKPEQVGVVSLRGGDVAGEHTVYFLGDGERIEISHRVSSRAVFGRGAVVLAEKLLGRKAGIYSARDLIGVAAVPNG